MRDANDWPEAQRQASHKDGLATPSCARKRMAMLEEVGRKEAGEAAREERDGERLPLRRRMLCCGKLALPVVLQLLSLLLLLLLLG